MEKKSFFQELTRYHVKVERDGKPVIEVPGILCLPGLLAAPRLGLAGIIAAPLLGYNVHIEDGDGKTVDVGDAVRKTAENVMETAAGTARTIKEEIDKAWQEISADDPETVENEETEEADGASAPDAECDEEPAADPEEYEGTDIPVKPDDSAQE